MFGERWPRARESLLEQQRVLVDKAERNEFGEASGLALDVAQQSQLRTQCAGVSACPYISVEVVRMPQRWAVRMTSIHCAVESLLAERMWRISSSRISAAVPGRVPSPLSRSIDKIVGAAACR